MLVTQLPVCYTRVLPLKRVSRSDILLRAAIFEAACDVGPNTQSVFSGERLHCVLRVLCCTAPLGILYSPYTWSVVA